MVLLLRRSSRISVLVVTGGRGVPRPYNHDSCRGGIHAVRCYTLIRCPFHKRSSLPLLLRSVSPTVMAVKMSG
jgi:hypothetical protein